MTANTCPNYANCPSTHCARGEECRSPSDCTVRTTGRRALLPAFKAHVEAMCGGPLPDWPEDPFRWDERFGGLPYSTIMANRFRDFMAGFDAAARERSEHSSPRQVEGEAEVAWGYVADLTRALTGLTCGGSEFFVRRHGRYIADAKACVDYVERARRGQHAAIVGAIRAKQAAEAALAGARLTHEDLSRLSRVFCAASDLRTDQDIRINEWLKTNIAADHADEGNGRPPPNQNNGGKAS